MMWSKQGLLGLMMLAGVLVPMRGGGTSPSVTRVTLDNGLRVILVRDALAPVATVVMNYLVGSNEAPPGFPGMAHAQEHMMFRGSPGLSTSQLAEISAAMGGSFDADTQQTVTQYFFSVPAEDLNVALHIESIRMRGVLDTGKSWAEERGAIEQEVAQDLSNPEYVFYTRLLEAMFRSTPYAHDALGTVASFNQTTGAMLRQFHDTWYAPNNAILVIAGDIQPQSAITEIKKLFGGIPARKLPTRPAVGLQPVKPESMRVPTDLPYGAVVTAFRWPGSESPDYAAVQVLSSVLNSQRAKLYDLAISGKALSTAFSMSALPKASLAYAMAAFPPGSGDAKLLSEVESILTGYARDGVPADLVEAAKRRKAAAAEFQRNSVSGLAMEWSNAVAVEGRPSPDEVVGAIERVTVADVNAAARKYLDLNHAITAELVPQPSGKPVSAKPPQRTESFTPKHTGRVPLPAWAEAALGRIEMPRSVVHPVVSKLPNGLTLIVQSESVSNTVSVYGHIRNNPDLQTPKGQEGVSDVLDQMLAYGTTSMDRVAFLKALDDIGADGESAGATFSVRVLSKYFDRGVQLLADNELQPALPDKDFLIVRRQLAAAQAGELTSPSYLTELALERALVPKDDHALRQATPASILSLSLANVKAYHRSVFRPDLTTIVVIGNITPRQAQETLGKYFGGWKATGPKPVTDLPPLPPNRPSITKVPDISRVQDNVILAETLGLTRSNPDYYALELGNNVLGGGFYAARLYRDLRETTGLVYFVASSLDAGKTRSYYRVTYACNPDNVFKARAIVERDLKDMQSAPLADYELKESKALLLREIPLSEATESAIAQGLLSRVEKDLPLDEPTRAARHYIQLTAEQVQAAYAKWIRPGDLAQVSEGPAPK